MFTVGQVVIEPGAGDLAPLAIGSVLMVMVYAGGPISGGHFNPAVTLAVLLRGKTSGRDLIGYWAAQLAGGILAALCVRVLKGGAPVPALELAVGPALLAELLFTFALVFVILNVATTRRAEGNSYFGLAIGFTVMAGAYAVGPVSGGVFNPAVAVGITVLGLSAPAGLWIFLVANLVGGVVAAFTFLALNPEERVAAPA